jgi:hypothetical protein
MEEAQDIQMVEEADQEEHVVVLHNIVPLMVVVMEVT